jgi:hypothetical protein
MVATLVATNEMVFMVGSGGVCFASFCSFKLGRQFCVGAFGRSMASVAVKLFSCVIYFKKKFYKYCTFNEIFQDNVANILYYCSTQKFIPINFHGPHYASQNITWIRNWNNNFTQKSFEFCSKYWYVFVCERYHSLQAIYFCLYNVFAATLHILRPSTITTNRGHAILYVRRDALNSEYFKPDEREPNRL